MVDIGLWLQTSGPNDPTAELAAINWRNIQDKPSTVTILRNGSPLASTYVVRIEPYSIAREDEKDFQTAGLQRAIIFGIKDHPDPLVVDTPLQINDEVIDGNRHFEIITIIPHWGGIQAVCEVMT